MITDKTCNVPLCINGSLLAPSTLTNPIVLVVVARRHEVFGRNTFTVSPCCLRDIRVVVVLQDVLVRVLDVVVTGVLGDLGQVMQLSGDYLAAVLIDVTSV